MGHKYKRDKSGRFAGSSVGRSGRVSRKGMTGKKFARKAAKFAKNNAGTLALGATAVAFHAVGVHQQRSHAVTSARLRHPNQRSIGTGPRRVKLRRNRYKITSMR